MRCMHVTTVPQTNDIGNFEAVSMLVHNDLLVTHSRTIREVYMAK